MAALRRSLLIAAAVLSASLAAAAPAAAQAELTAVTAQDRAIGRADAPVTVVEYASFACPTCADWHRLVWPLFKQRLVDTGQVRFVFRNLPTQPEQMSLPAAALARCAAPERFFDVTSALMQGQEAVHRGGAREDWYAPAIAVSGRTQEQIEACAATPETRAAINRDIASAHAAGARHTPSFFVNGKPVNDRTLGGLEAAVRAAAER